MLLLARKTNQGIILPDFNIRIFIHEIRGKQVRIAIEAPDGVRVYRDELLHTLTGNNARPESGEGSDTPRNPSSLPAVSTLPAVPANAVVTMPPANPVQLWNRVQSRKSAHPAKESTND
jgi:carbon storage regulator CsrA